MPRLLRHFCRSAAVYAVVMLAGSGLGEAAWAATAGSVVMVSGQATLQRGGQTSALAQGQDIESGDTILTGQGYAYLKLLDGTFIILRQNTRASVPEYEYNAAKAAISRVRIHLEEGVLRAVTGDGVKQARDRFRLNTPVAAIGVRGTDFTVAADEASVRVSVQTGGVVMTPLGGDCAVTAVGSCEGGRAAELFAGQPHLMLQLNKGELRPSLAPADQKAPDKVNPPAAGEGSLGKAATAAPQDAAAANSQVSEVVSLNRTRTLAEEPASHQTTPPPADTGTGAGTGTGGSTPVVTPPVVTPPAPPAINWGRWESVAGKPAEVDLQAAVAAGRRILAINATHVLMQPQVAPTIPGQGVYTFNLQQGEAFYHDSKGVHEAAIQNPSLSIDFGKSAFSTQMQVTSSGQSWDIKAAGDITRTGQLVSNFNAGSSNSTVRGTLVGEQAQGAQYLFNRTLNANEQITGATAWTRP